MALSIGQDKKRITILAKIGSARVIVALTELSLNLDTMKYATVGRFSASLLLQVCVSRTVPPHGPSHASSLVADATTARAAFDELQDLVYDAHADGYRCRPDLGDVFRCLELLVTSHSAA